MDSDYRKPRPDVSTRAGSRSDLTPVLLKRYLARHLYRLLEHDIEMT